MTIEDLKRKITEAPLEPKAICHSLMFIFDWKSFIEDKLSTPPLQYTSKYNSFSFTVEGGEVKFRGKRLPQDEVSAPRSGIRIVKKDVIFDPVSSADFRIENIHFDEIWKGLNLTMPQLDASEQRRVKLSWEKLRESLESLPRRRRNLRTMKITELPKQKKQALEIPRHLLEEESVQELTGDKFPETIEDGEFDDEIAEDVDVVVYTDERHQRPWVGRVIKLLEGRRFLLQWFTRKTSRSKTFFALLNSDGSPSVTEQEQDSVMFWLMSERRTENSFDLSPFWLEAIQREYCKLDREANV